MSEWNSIKSWLAFGFTFLTGTKVRLTGIGFVGTAREVLFVPLGRNVEDVPFDAHVEIYVDTSTTNRATKIENKPNRITSLICRTLLLMAVGGGRYGTALLFLYRLLCVCVCVCVCVYRP